MPPKTDRVVSKPWTEAEGRIVLRVRQERKDWLDIAHVLSQNGYSRTPAQVKGWFGRQVWLGRPEFVAIAGPITSVTGQEFRVQDFPDAHSKKRDKTKQEIAEASADAARSALSYRAWAYHMLGGGPVRAKELTKAREDVEKFCGHS